eukprot:1209037-Amphidinium_carterae.1
MAHSSKTLQKGALLNVYSRLQLIATTIDNRLGQNCLTDMQSLSILKIQEWGTEAAQAQQQDSRRGSTCGNRRK